MKPLLKAFFDNKLALNLVLALVPFLTYTKAIYYDFSPVDDVWLIINNQGILSDWGNMLEAFRHATSDVYYRPLLFDTFILDYHIKGLNSHVFHFTNIVLHVITVLLLFRFLLQYAIKKEQAFIFSVLFALHPVLLHSVAWVPGRNDVMLALFCMASLYFQNNYLKNAKLKNVVFQFFFFILALFTKETAIAMPIVFAGNAFIKNSSAKRIGVNFIIALAFTIPWYLYRKTVVKEIGFLDGDLVLKLKNVVSSFLIFSGKVVFPVQHSLYPTIQNSSVWPGVITLFVLVALALYFKFSNKRYAYFGIFLYLIFLSIPIWFVSGSITREQYENRLYMPMIGLLLFVLNLNIQWEKQLVRVFLGLIGLLYFGTTFLRMDNYKDYRTYIEMCIEDNPDNYFFRERYADELVRLNDLNAALVQYSEAIRIQPSRPLFYNNRANVYTSLGKKDEALRDFDSAIAKSGNDPRVYLNRCVSLSRLNECDAAMSELNKLKQCCQDIIPMEVENEITMRWTMEGFNKIDALLKKQPNNAVLYANRAKLYYDIGRKNEALADKQKALSLAPENEQIKAYLQNIK